MALHHVLAENFLVAFAHLPTCFPFVTLVTHQHGGPAGDGFVLLHDDRTLIVVKNVLQVDVVDDTVYLQLDILEFDTACMERQVFRGEGLGCYEDAALLLHIVAIARGAIVFAHFDTEQLNPSLFGPEMLERDVATLEFFRLVAAAHQRGTNAKHG